MLVSVSQRSLNQPETSTPRSSSAATRRAVPPSHAATLTSRVRREESLKGDPARRATVGGASAVVKPSTAVPGLRQDPALQLVELLLGDRAAVEQLLRLRDLPG